MVLRAPGSSVCSCCFDWRKLEQCARILEREHGRLQNEVADLRAARGQIRSVLVGMVEQI